MKRFVWPLQRLLDVTIRREEVLRGELAKLAGQIANLKQEVLRRRQLLNGLLEELGKQSFEKRMPQQAVFMFSSVKVEKEIEKFREEIKGLEERRAATTAAFLKERAKRQTLEKLRQQAMQRHRLEQEKIEQKQLDEAGRGAFVRRLAANRLQLIHED